jgi:hypothetical protein
MDLDFLLYCLLEEFSPQDKAFMTKVAIMPIPAQDNGTSYCAIAGDKQSYGNTAGEALDALMPRLQEDERGMLVVVQNFQPDQFFDAVQQQRLSKLMSRWRNARDQGRTLSPDEQTELDDLIQVELLASATRAQTVLAQVSR